MTFLKAALNAQRRAAEKVISPRRTLCGACANPRSALNIDQEMLRRPLNVGFSGGEKKRFEVLQMALLAPRVGVLDETDSGLDIDALRVVAEGVNALRDSEARFCCHYALSAAAGSHQAGCGACDGQGPDCRHRRP